MKRKLSKLLHRSVSLALSEPDSVLHHAAILHIDIVGSTELVQKNPLLAHRQIQQLYQRLRQLCQAHNGIPRELRGDAAVVEFTSAVDAVRATLAIHAAHELLNRTRIGKVNPDLRSGISYGAIISDDCMITGEAVIRAQRIEQLAAPGTVLFDQAVFDQLGTQSEFRITALGSHRLKGFDQTAAIYQAATTQSGSANRVYAALGYFSQTSDSGEDRLLKNSRRRFQTQATNHAREKQRLCG